jgi:hypothetical protein
MGLQNIFYFRKISLDDVCHVAEALKQSCNFLLQGRAKDIRDFRLHHSDHALDFFLISSILRHEGALEFHDSLHDDLELANFGFLFIWQDVVIFF